MNDKKDPSDRPGTKAFVIVVAAIAAINNCNLGYDIGIVSGVGPLLQKQSLFEVDDVKLELFIGALDVASLIGAFSSNLLADRFGRKGCMALSEVLFIISVLGMGMSQNYTQLIIFRCLCGIGVGLGLTIGPLYIGEIAPDEMRGKLISWSELATNVGLLVAFVVGYCFSGLSPNVSWRVMLSLGALLPGILLACLYYMPESPRWLIVQDREDEAREVLRKIYADDVNTDDMVYAIQDAIAAEAEDFKEGGWNAIFFPTTPVFYALLAGVGIASIQQLCGIEAITSYFLFIFEKAEVDASDQYLYLILFGFCKLITVYFAAQYFDNPNVGRRSLLLVSGTGVCVAMLLFLISFSYPVSSLTKTLSVFSMFWYVIAYSIGYGPGAWVVMLEVLPMQIRAKGLSVSTFVNRAFATMLSSSFLSMVNTLGYQGYFLLFTLITAGCVLYVFFLIPETQGLSLEDMSSIFQDISSVGSGSQCGDALVSPDDFYADEAYDPNWASANYELNNPNWAISGGSRSRSSSSAATGGPGISTRGRSSSGATRSRAASTGTRNTGNSNNNNIGSITSNNNSINSSSNTSHNSRSGNNLNSNGVIRNPIVTKASTPPPVSTQRVNESSSLLSSNDMVNESNPSTGSSSNTGKEGSNNDTI